MDLEGSGVSDVNYKIKNIRSSYCQELKKIQFSQPNCSSPDDVYKPTVVWFNTLHSFLKSFVLQRDRPQNHQLVSSVPLYVTAKKLNLLREWEIYNIEEFQICILHDHIGEYKVGLTCSTHKG
jgi:hypothetical protein